MVNIEQLYTKEIFSRLGYHATWLPNAYRQLGSVGRLDGNVFMPERHLNDFGIEFRSVVQARPADIRYHSEGAVSVTTKARGQAPVSGSSLLEGQAGTIIEFSRAAAVYLDLQECVITSFEDPAAIADTILLRHDEGRWDQRDVIITQLFESRLATILISSDRAARAELIVGGNSSVGNQTLNGGVGLSIVTGNSLSTQIVASSATPLFSLGTIKRSFFEEASFQSRIRKLIPDSGLSFHTSPVSDAVFATLTLD